MTAININACNIALGNQLQVGIGPECAPCVPSNNLTWLRVVDSFDPGMFREKEAKRSKLGRRDNITELKVTSTGSNFTFEMPIPYDSLGIFLGGILGDLTSDSNWRHIFNVENEKVCPPTYTIAIVTPFWSKRITGAVLGTFQLALSENEVPQLTITGEGAYPEDDPTLLPMVYQEETFELKHFCVFHAPLIGDIDADLAANDGSLANPYDTKLCVYDLNLNIENELNTRYCLGDTDDCFNKLVIWGNKTTTMDFTKRQEDSNWSDAFEADDSGACAYRVMFQDKDNPIGPGFPTFIVNLFHAGITNYTPDFPDGDLITENIEVTAIVDPITDLTMNAVLRTEQDDTMYRPQGC